jgi:hypothetical protein
MVSRRAGRTFSDLVCGTGVHHIRTVPAQAGAVLYSWSGRVCLRGVEGPGRFRMVERLNRPTAALDKAALAAARAAARAPAS